MKWIRKNYMNWKFIVCAAVVCTIVLVYSALSAPAICPQCNTLPCQCILPCVNESHVYDGHLGRVVVYWTGLRALAGR